MMVDLLKRRGGIWGTPDQVVAALQDQGWTEERARRTLDAALKSDPRIKSGKSGTIKFSGTDRAIYGDVALRLKAWAATQGYRNCRPVSCHSAARSKVAGMWLYPDLLMLADPPRRATATAPLEVHAIEVEQRKGFSIQSVYQAYEQGRGADYSWVFFHGSASDSESWTRTVRASRELGVGLVAMTDADAWRSWERREKAPRRTHIESADRAFLLRAAGLTAESLQLRES